MTKREKADNDNDGLLAPQSFGVFLAKLGDGELLLDAAEQLQEAVQALEGAEGKASASLTMKLTLQRDKGTVDVVSELSVKLPKSPVARTVFWVDKSGHLVSENPRQQKLPLRDAGAAPVMRGQKDGTSDE